MKINIVKYLLYKRKIEDINNTLSIEFLDIINSDIKKTKMIKHKSKIINKFLELIQEKFNIILEPDDCIIYYNDERDSIIFDLSTIAIQQLKDYYKIKN